MLGVSEEDTLNLDGEESPEVMAKARAEVERERSESRERTGREEMVGTGRGGKGNYRSTSRGRELDLGRVPTVQEEQEREKVKSELEREREVMEQHLQKRNQERSFTTGRGEHFPLAARAISALTLPDEQVEPATFAAIDLRHLKDVA